MRTVRSLPFLSLAIEIDGMVLSPGVPASSPLVREAERRSLPVIAEVELAFPFLDGTVVAITGSNGKSTTATLTARDARGVGSRRRGLRQHRRAAGGAGRRSARPRVRGRAVELPARDRSHLPRRRRGAAQRLARSPRPLPATSRPTPRPRRGIFERQDEAVDRGPQRRRSGDGGDRRRRRATRAGAGSRCAARSRTAAIVDGGARDRGLGRATRRGALHRRRRGAGRQPQPRERDGGGAARARRRRRSRPSLRRVVAPFDGLPHRTRARRESAAASSGTTTPRAPTSAPRRSRSKGSPTARCT